MSKEPNSDQIRVYMRATELITDLATAEMMLDQRSAETVALAVRVEELKKARENQHG